MPQLMVRARIPGSSGESLPDVLIDLASERSTLRQLIQRTVEEQVREVAAGRAPQASMDRQYLSDTEIREMAARGVVRRPREHDTVPDPAAEVDRAVRAFARGTFAVLVGGRQVDSLDEPITVRLGESVVFLRLTPLVGG
jgi:hypothetical protein